MCWEEMKATLQLEDGSEFHGRLFGSTANANIAGEIVFQTGMVGYVESLSDPSYHRQLVVLTYPLIGNYGVSDNAKDKDGIHHFESHRIWAKALIVDWLCPENEHSHWSATRSLNEWLKEQGVVGLAGIDTRQLTKRIRERGTMKAKIVVEGTTDADTSIPFVDINAENLVAQVSRQDCITYGKGNDGPRILAVDCGLKNNQIRCLLSRGAVVEVVPWNYEFSKRNDYDGLFLTNGPGDPEVCKATVDEIRKILNRKNGGKTPIMGICLGHQLLARAAGFETKKLKYGNRGHNQPCTHVDTGRCYITSQNHGYAVEIDKDGKDGWRPLFINENDKTNEGIVHETLPYFGVQFHPEHAAGPMDMELLFDVFLDVVRNSIGNTGDNTPCVREMITSRLRYTPQPELLSGQKARKVLLLGSGGLSIGQAGEFDYSGSQALKALKEAGVQTVLINPNIATVQTTKGFADRTYFVPLTAQYVQQVIETERPDGILLTFGGQTALNCGIELEKEGVLEKFGVNVLGTPISTIVVTEDRKLFADKMAEIGERIAPSRSAENELEALNAAKAIGYPVLVRAAFSLGGLGSGFADNDNELLAIVRQAFAHSPQVLLDKSLRGWKELEYEVVRDAYDNCITVCNMENVDPLGIHTGESVVVAPSQTLTDSEYQRLRRTSLKVIRQLGVVGECNIQYAVNPQKPQPGDSTEGYEDFEYYIIEVNARLSRSSALASKATGYPLAYVAAKIALGNRLPTLINSVTRTTTACFEPSLDYCVVKIPRWDLKKFSRVDNSIGSSMKSVGEVMGIGRCFEEAFQKALRMVDEHCTGFVPPDDQPPATDQDLSKPTDRRMFAIASALSDAENQAGVERVHRLTGIDRWFLHRMQSIMDIRHRLLLSGNSPDGQLTRELLLEAKKAGYSDRQIADLVLTNESTVRSRRRTFGLHPWVKQIDTVAAEWPAETNYLYLTYNAGQDDVVLSGRPLLVDPAERPSTPSVLSNPVSNTVAVLGSGVYRIGSSVEFDACSVACVQQLRQLGKQTIMVNCNPETVSTDYDMCDRLYFEEISYETVVDIHEAERPLGFILCMGGQLPNNIAMKLHLRQVPILGTSPEDIDKAENRFKFSRELDRLNIKQPRWKNADNIETAKTFCQEVGYPCLIRPSYVLSGAAMNVAYDDEELEAYLRLAGEISKDRPTVVSKFIANAKEIDVDMVARGGVVVAQAVSEHVENAGVHSGDATLVTPPDALNAQTLGRIASITRRIAHAFNVTGPANLQLIAKDNELKVIECNLRVSRSFPFVSKTLDYDFVAAATKVIIGIDVPQRDVVFGADTTATTLGAVRRIGVKVPQFSFSRLSGADVMLGVEMASTGEVASFGATRHEAFLKALLSTGFTIPNKNIMISFGGFQAKTEMLPSVKTLSDLGFDLFGSKGTADFYATYPSEGCRIEIKPVEWLWEEGDEMKSKAPRRRGLRSVSEYVSRKEFDLIIDLPHPARSQSSLTHGFMLRRMAIDNNIPLITNLKCAAMFCEALRLMDGKAPPLSSIDRITSQRLIRLPGLIDVHVHMRQPGATHKEEWSTGTAAALAGGVTMVLAMPNTDPPLIGPHELTLVDKLARVGARCDYGLYGGATMNNVQALTKLAVGQKISAVKMYLNDTFAALKLDDVACWIEHMKSLPKDCPLVCHAEGRTVAAAIAVATMCQRHIHIAHVSTEEEITIVREAKEAGLKVSCEVAPHHLFLTAADLPGGTGTVRPPLGIQKDQEALWRNLKYIDCFATDHAPHTVEEKLGEKSPPGFPGLETMLPLLLTAVGEKRLTIEDIVLRLYTNPRRLFGLPEQPLTFIEVDLDGEWTVAAKQMFTRAQWTPFEGRKLKGRVTRVVLRGKDVFMDGKILADPGTGLNIKDGYPGAVTPIYEMRDTYTTVMEELTLTSKQRLSPRHVKEASSVRRRLHSAKEQVMTSAIVRDDVIMTDGDSSPSPSPPPIVATSGGKLKKRRKRLSSLLGLTGQHLISVDVFNRNMLHELYEVTDKFRLAIQRGERIELLRGKVMGSMFYEVSTRTAGSFAAAMYRLGGDVIHMDANTSSVQKGESLEDSVRVVCGYADVLVLRHALVGAAARAMSVATRPVVNAGDGTGEHPTQALLDIYTIRQELGTANQLTIAMVGDLKNGRTVHSLARLLCVYGGLTFHYIAPEGLGMPEHVRQYVHQHGVQQVEFDSLAQGIDEAHVVYMTRIQKERFSSEEEYNKHKGVFVITPKLLNETRRSRMSEGSQPIVMHPLPRVDEISPELDQDVRAAYFREAENGMYVRMAILAMILGDE